MNEKAIEAALRKQFNSRLHGPEGDVLIFENELPKMAKEIAAALPTGQEWREPEGWRKAMENAALFLEIAARYAPNEVVDERIKATKERLKLRGLRDVMYAVAKDCRDALLPAPPVAEPLLTGVDRESEYLKQRREHPDE